MSQDLFAAFGSAPAPPSSTMLISGAGIDLARDKPIGLDPSVRHIEAEAEDEDDFGDFEDAEPPPSQTASSLQSSVTVNKPDRPLAVDSDRAKVVTKLPFDVKPATKPAQAVKIGRHPFADHMNVLFAADDEDYDAGKDELDDLANNPEAAMAYSKKIIEEQMASQAKAKQNSKTQQHDSKPLPVRTGRVDASTKVTAKERDPNVLFDAENISDDEPETNNADQDDWGDFEDTVVAEQTAPLPKRETTVPSVDLLGLDDDVATLPVRQVNQKPINRAQTNSKSLLISNTSTKLKPATKVLVESDEPWDDFEDRIPIEAIQFSTKSTTRSSAISLTQPPTNIPPPSMLLSYFGTMLKSLPSPNAIEGFVESVIVLAHVLAGRKYRWKRSTILASSMRIGPAAAGGKSGMKLAGVDRSEVTREDREVAEIFSAWRRQVGKLRAAFSTGFSGRSLKLPELQETLPVKTLKALNGGFTAPHECALCGLRREERVAKIDDHVQDSFGEWWVDAVSMHTSCAKWWSINEPAMRGR